MYAQRAVYSNAQRTTAYAYRSLNAERQTAHYRAAASTILSIVPVATEWYVGRARR